MRLGFHQFVINPTFPVNRMLSNNKHMAVADDLYCRILVLAINEKPLYHLSIDTVEVHLSYRDKIKAVIEEVLDQKIDLITSATHSHYCPCLKTDEAYKAFFLDELRKNINKIKFVEDEQIRYSYRYEFFDKTGKSRISDQDSKNIFAETLSFYLQDKRVATVLIYNSHPTTQKMQQGDFTAEYPGYVIRRLKELYPDEFFTFMLGPAGDISSRFTRRKQDYEEMEYLGELLVQEYQRQLNLPTARLVIDKYSYKEMIVPIKRVKVDFDIEIPDYIVNRERETIERALDDYKTGKRKLDISSQPSEHLFCHLVLADEYSMIFEPFETFSSYYDHVDKEHCSLITISNGFDHYLLGLNKQRITFEMFADNVSKKTKEHIIQILHDLSHKTS